MTDAAGNATDADAGADVRQMLTLTGGTSTSAITIPLTYAGTPTPVHDYAGQPGSVTMPAGATLWRNTLHASRV